MVNALVLGRTGQLARELQRCRWPAEWAVRYSDCHVIELAKPNEAAAAVRAVSPDMVISAAAYMAVDYAECERDLANLVNAEPPRAIAQVCMRFGIPFVTISTDYVFDGAEKSAYREEDDVTPISAYDHSKELGERYVRDAHGRHLILHASWLFSVFDNNFVRTMLRLGAQKPLMSIVGDQRGKPAAVGDLAALVIAVSERLQAMRKIAGICHVASADVVTWYDFARAIFDQAKLVGAQVPETIRPITSAEYPTLAKRPLNSELACEKFEQLFGLQLRSWREALPDMLDELLSAKVAI